MEAFFFFSFSEGFWKCLLPRASRAETKAVCGFRLGYGQPEPITLEQQGLPLLQLSLLGRSRARKHAAQPG